MRNGSYAVALTLFSVRYALHIDVVHLYIYLFCPLCVKTQESLNFTGVADSNALVSWLHIVLLMGDEFVVFGIR